MAKVAMSEAPSERETMIRFHKGILSDLSDHKMTALLDPGKSMDNGEVRLTSMGVKSFEVEVWLAWGERGEGEASLKPLDLWIYAIL